jgi:hypothetical protein
MEAIESGEAARTPIDVDAAAVVAWVRSIGLKSGDVQELILTAPDGETLLAQRARPLQRNEAQSLFFAGKRRPLGGWPAGAYRAIYRVLVAGAPVLERSFSLTLGAPSR